MTRCIALEPLLPKGFATAEQVDQARTAQESGHERARGG